MTIEEKAIESQKYHKEESKENFNLQHINFSEWCYGWCQGAKEQKIAIINKLHKILYPYTFGVFTEDDLNNICKELNNNEMLS